MNQLYKYEDIENFDFYNSFKYQTIFISKMMEEGIQEVSSTDEMHNFIPDENEMFFISKDGKMK